MIRLFEQLSRGSSTSRYKVIQLFERSQRFVLLVIIYFIKAWLPTFLEPSDSTAPVFSTRRSSTLITSGHCLRSSICPSAFVDSHLRDPAPTKTAQTPQTATLTTPGARHVRGVHVDLARLRARVQPRLVVLRGAQRGGGRRKVEKVCALLCQRPRSRHPPRPAGCLPQLPPGSQAGEERREVMQRLRVRRGLCGRRAARRRRGGELCG